MTKNKKRTLKILIIIASVITITAVVIMSVWFGCNEIQKALIRMMCSDKPSSVPTDYEAVRAATTLTTHSYNADNELDVIEPKDFIDANNPTLVIFHGGYYIGGGRHNQEPYARLISSKGFRVVNVDYSLAPERSYPCQLTDANDALNFIAHLYPNATFVLSGDSAGAHLASQLTAAICNAELKSTLNLSSVTAARITGFIGNCGFYEASTVKSTGFPFINSALQMMLNDRNYDDNPHLRELDITNYALGFPPSLLICGDKDPFITQNTAFAAALRRANVITQTYFPVTQDKALGHEFQCNFALSESYIAVNTIIDFLSSLTI